MKKVILPPKSMTMYLTVRVDIELPADMEEQDAKSTAVAEFDYDFKLLEWSKMRVCNTEICDANDEL